MYYAELTVQAQLVWHCPERHVTVTVAILGIQIMPGFVSSWQNIQRKGSRIFSINSYW